MQKSLYEDYRLQEETHWWFLGRYKIFTRLLALRPIPAHVARALDIGCGTGYLLGYLAPHVADDVRLVGTDFVVRSQPSPRFTLVESRIEALPFADGEFDTVICTHVIEHILDYRQAIAELRRICRRRLIVVVPQEREGRYNFNAHFNFFPYPESFLRAMIPVPASHHCRQIGRDIYYREDMD